MLESGRVRFDEVLDNLSLIGLYIYVHKLVNI